jgi:hypothetical protein
MHDRWRSYIVRGLLLVSLVGFAGLVHLPTHLVTALGTLVRRDGWIDSYHMRLPQQVRALAWLPPLVLLLVLWLQARRDQALPIPRRLRRFDVAIALSLAGMAVTLRLWPLLREPWLKPDVDEGVYLGGAWLLSQGVLPYRDFVFAHLPGALLMLLPAAFLIEPGQANDLALLVARATVACMDGLTAGLIYLAMRQLAPPPGALLAAIVYASDAVVVQTSRSVLLEPLQAPWIVAGMGLVLASQHGRRLGGAAGLCLAVGVAIKLSGAVAPIAALLIIVAERQWRLAGDLVAGLLVGAVLVCGWSVLFSGDEIIRQTVLLQLERPDVRPWNYWDWLLGDRWMAVTATASFLGIGTLSTHAWLGHRVAPGWRLMLLWSALTLLLFALISDFYDHYYVALVAPLACLAAALSAALPGPYRRGLLPALVLLLGPLWWGQASTWGDVDRAATIQPTVRALQAMPGEQAILSFNPMINVLAGRPIVQVPDGPYLLDAFLGETYLDSALDRRWPRALEAKIAAAGSAELLVGTSEEMDFLPTLHRSFVWQSLDQASGNLLWTRADQPEHRVTIGRELELLRPAASRLERLDDRWWLVQPLHWRADDTPPPDLALALHLYSPDGTRLSQVDVPVNGGIEWTAGIITSLEYRLPLPDRLAPGTYSLRAQVYSWTNGSVVPMRVGVAQTEQETLELPPVIVP